MITSELLSAAGFKHAFSTRNGGVSRPPFESLNLARGIGDDEGAVETNRTRFLSGIRKGLTDVFELSQVHGNHLREVERLEVPKVVREEAGDGLIARAPGVAVGVRTADCVPLLMADPSTGAVAAVHAGWRGVEKRIVTKAVRALTDAPRDLLVAIGPHIRVASFEVGDEVVELLSGATSEPTSSFVDGTRAKPHVDLAVVVLAQLREVGVEFVDVLPGDTFAEPERFFSYRRDGKQSGRHLSVIVSR